MKSITSDNYVIRPFRVNKSWSIPYSFMSASSGTFINLASAPPANWNSFVSGTNTNTNGISKQTLYQSVQHLFYTGSDDGTSSAYIPVVTDKKYYPTGSAFYVVNIAQQKFGEGVKPSTFRIRSSTSTASIYDDGFGRLVSTTNTASVIGNIFYGVGIAVVSQDTSSFSSSLVTNRGLYLTTGSTVTIDFGSTYTIYEHQIICTMEPGEFNYSFNPSTRNRTISASVLGSGSEAQDLIYSGTLQPYFTTVGFYTDMYELVAIAKVPSPIQRSIDTQQTIIVRFDA